MRDVFVELPPGFIGNPQAVPRCPRQKFEGGSPQCPASTQVGILRATVVGLGQVRGAVYNLIPPPGIATQLGFSAGRLQLAAIRLGAEAKKATASASRPPTSRSRSPR